MPLVSVVVPTLHRPKLVLRALASVFAQSHDQLEVIVVVDGPDDETVRALASIADPRLQVIVNPRSLSAAQARNIGADRATGEWLAFLDDDDEWLPKKIETQLACAAGREDVVVTCLSRVVTQGGVAVQPQTPYDNGDPIDEYLFDRRSRYAGTGFLQTSSYLMRLSLFQRARFDVGTPHDDWSLILRLRKQFKARLETVPDVLVVVYTDAQRPSLSKKGTWRQSLVWIDSIRPMITRRAYSGFCLGVVGSRAARERAFPAFFLLLYRSLRHGAPRLWHVLPFFGYWLLPERALARLRG